jgi:hypothetical protein
MFGLGNKKASPALSSASGLPLARPDRKEVAAVGEELLDRTLQQIPSVTGRLTYLASLLDPTLAQYRHLVLERLVGPQVTDKILRTAHRAVFYQWLSLSLVQHRGDINRYLGLESSDDYGLLRRVRDSRGLETLPPQDAALHERELFMGDLLLLFQSLLFDLGE